MRVVSLALVLAMLGACSRQKPAPPPQVPAELASLAGDALHAASQIKVSGDIDAVLRRHTLAPRYATAMRKHFELMTVLHRAGVRAHVRHPRYTLQLRHEQFCQDETTANLVISTMTRYDMESIPPAEGAPPYTAGAEEHVFRFERRGGAWVMALHHEISLAEMHQKGVAERLRNPCRR